MRVSACEFTASCEIFAGAGSLTGRFRSRLRWASPARLKHFTNRVIEAPAMMSPGNWAIQDSNL